MRRSPWFVAGAALAALAGCKGMEALTQVGVATGRLTDSQAGSINRVSKAVEKTFQDITPEQEHYIGRSVAATLMTTYRPYEDPAANRYVNLVGQSVAAASNRPETFGGYHFQILDSDEVNAFAAPGGLILVSRGMLRLAQSEDQLAAILAHEVSHVQGKHGLQAIEKGRLTGALVILAAEGAKQAGSEELAKLTEAFEGTVTDVTKTLTNSGNSRKLERDADRDAVEIMKRVGYDPKALVQVLDRMKHSHTPGGPGFAKTHPDPKDRIKDVEGAAGSGSSSPSPAARQKRFAQALGKI